uniref:Uncharacterized protein n=1 Tax=Anopheles dirus TaxID=7168 RepID=A0A182NY72_9DIPT
MKAHRASQNIRQPTNNEKLAITNSFPILDNT